MNYFNGLHFVGSDYLPDYQAYLTRQFKDYYGIQYSQDGKLMVEMNGTYKRIVSGPWVLITRPGPVFRYGAVPGKRRLHAFVCFKGPRVKTYIRSGLLPLNPRDPLIRITRPTRFLETLRQLTLLLNPANRANYHRAVHALEDLLLQLHEQPAETGIFPEYWREIFQKLEERIAGTPEHNWNFPATAKAMNISYPHFRRLFQMHSGMALGHFLTQARLRQAASRLISTKLQIKTLAEQCGFEDSFYFSRLFKKHYRLSPLRYRSEYKS